MAGNTQEEIATKLNVSRQAAQRLVALAVSEKLIKFRLDHPLSSCIALAESLRDKFDLSVCEVVPSPVDNGDLRSSLGVCAATYLENYLTAAQHLIIGVAGGLSKVEAIRAALQGKLVNGLITDEAAAEAILGKR